MEPPVSTVANSLSKADSALIVLHTHSDADSAGSALALSKTLSAAVDIAAPDTVQSNAKPLFELNKTAVVSDPEVDEYDVVVVVDAPTSNRIDPVDVLNISGDLILIDHHSPGNLADQADIPLVDTDADATAVLVYKILTELVDSLKPDAAIGIAAGLLDDTAFLADANTDAVAIATNVLANIDGHSELLVNMHSVEPSYSERIATAKAVARAKGYKAGQTILMITHCGSDEGAAATTLIDAGADIALVISGRSDRTWVVARVRNSEETVHLPDDVLAPLVHNYEGESGGHSRAGTAKLNTSDTESVGKACLRQVETTLGMTFGAVE